ncbi:SRPBCC domain-containing protein [Brevundimonas sp. M20]|uniref:SRPBCC domain-containing protein n=1 Tax=Brevundimonas sp. M20 TaxID=2591463 RepID=UPI001146D58D|nr:SRPBCC domain-containing protein [Brevundimonas sp. M20]QDH72210.1 polyketide cyclase [Brevundimonas sp. M20]
MTAETPSVAHGTFVLKRRYDAAAERVFRAWADPISFRRWFVEAPGATVHEWRHDFRVGGKGGGRYRFGGPQNVDGFNDTLFLDIVENRRIILSYVMGTEVGGERTRSSASQATIELVADGAGVLLTYTEQGAYFGEDGAAHIPLREEGCAQMLENLARFLEGVA